MNLDGPRRERDFRGDEPADEGPVIGSLGVFGDGIERIDDSLHGWRELNGFVVFFEAGFGELRPNRTRQDVQVEVEGQFAAELLDFMREVAGNETKRS